MSARWTTVLSMAFFVVVLALATADRAAACSGDDCGCNVEAEQCRAQCPAGEGHMECVSACNHEAILCAKCCCCECWNCRGCGVVVITELAAPSDGPKLVIATLLDAANRCAPASRGDELFVDQCR